MKLRLLQNKIFLALLVMILSAEAVAQQSVITYTSTEADIPNPERGWYDQYTTHSGSTTLGTNYISIKAEDLLQKREKDNLTLILRLFMLHEFLDTEALSQEYLSLMQEDFDAIRSAGMKVIVRFAYSLSQSAEVWDATPEKVFSHIASLGDVLWSNADIIVAVQAGFIGAWGEWYYTKNFAGQGYVPDETDKENRITLVENLLNILPDNVMVEARTPAQMQYLTKSADPITEVEAFDGSFKSRIGHHNDCFVASSSDYGTYTNLTEDLAYLHEATKYTITGGETCDGSNSYSDCANSVSRLITLHWTYMNRGYNRTVYKKWEEQGCYEDVNISLGYRLSLTSATIADQTSQGSDLNLTFHFQNSGYAAPTQYKPIQLVLTNTQTLEKTILNFTGTNDDIRYWLPGEIVCQGNVSLPPDLEDGNYILSMRLPDQDDTLAENPAYSIQLANAGVWDETEGSNNLNHILVVGNGGPGTLPEAPDNLDATTVSYTRIDLSWKDNSNDESGFEIMRSQSDGSAWNILDTLDANQTNFQDMNAEKGEKYNYIIRSFNAYGASAWSDSASATTLGVDVAIAEQVSYSYYPNPLGDNNLHIDFPDHSAKRILVFDIAGVLIFEKNTNDMNISLERSLFDSGLYLLKINLQNEVVENIIVVDQ